MRPVAPALGCWLWAAAALPAASEAQDRCAGAEAQLRAAAGALERGLWPEAERALQAAAAGHDGCASLLVGQARLRAARGDAEQAERLFAEAIERAPGDALAHAHFARYWLSRGQLARADYHSSAALSLDPGCADALVAAGQVLARRGRSQAAFATLERAARAGPDHPEAQFRLGVALFRLRRHADAASRFERAAALRPLDARIHDYRALCLESLGDADGAERLYRSGLALDGGPFPDPFLDHNYGRFLLKQGRLEESRLHLDRALVRQPRSRSAHYEHARLNLALKRYAEAREDGERALGLADPSGLVLDVQVYYLLATVHARLGQGDLARRYAELARTAPIPDRE